MSGSLLKLCSVLAPIYILGLQCPSWVLTPACSERWGERQEAGLPLISAPVTININEHTGTSHKPWRAASCLPKEREPGYVGAKEEKPHPRARHSRLATALSLTLSEVKGSWGTVSKGHCAVSRTLGGPPASRTVLPK